MDKKTILLSQVIMTFIMASTMSGLMGLIIGGGPSAEWLGMWGRSFIVAWPIAFALTMVAWPLSMALTAAVLRPRPEPVAVAVEND